MGMVLSIYSQKGFREVTLPERGQELLEVVLQKELFALDQDVCLGDGCGCDRFCSRVWGCPGKTWDFQKNKAQIDPVACVGCGVCAKLCPSGAIKVEGGEEA